MIDKELLKQQIGKRKHHSHMTEREKIGLFNRLKSVQKWGIVSHALERLEEKGIEATYEDIVSTIYNAEIIEYRIIHNPVINGGDERVILRAKAIVNRCYNLNVVYSLTCEKVITVWINHIKDRHKTLRWELYDPDMIVLGV